MTTIPIFLHLQPVLAPLSIPEPPLLLDPKDAQSNEDSKSKSKPTHLHFVLTLHDPVHNLRFTTVSQSVPGDWLEVEYDQSEWVEERLVDVIRVGVEIIAQDVSPIPPSVSLQFPTPITGRDGLLMRPVVCRDTDGIEAFGQDTAGDAKVRRQEGGGSSDQHRRSRSQEGRLTIGMIQ